MIREILTSQPQQTLQHTNPSHQDEPFFNQLQNCFKIELREDRKRPVFMENGQHRDGHL